MTRWRTRGRRVVRLRPLRVLGLAGCACAAVFLASCSSLRYYGQAIRGQSQLVVDRRPVTAVIADQATPPALAARLRKVLAARRYASSALGLPDNRSYTTYVDLKRPYVVWNVYVTPPYSVAAIPQCFPIAGCVAYRGWFSKAAADADAARWRARGDDVWVGGVSAYSTLGWFADPVVSSMLAGDAADLVGTVFHELAHQLIYVKGDTAFNESFASFVQTAGLKAWRQSQGLAPDDGGAREREDGFTRLVLDLRARLQTLYASGAGTAELQAGKEREFAAFRTRYEAWRDQHWPDFHGYDAWVAAGANNARLVPFGVYTQWVPGFAALFARSGDEWPAFYAEVRRLAKEPRPTRDQRLAELSRQDADAGVVPAKS